MSVLVRLCCTKVASERIIAEHRGGKTGTRADQVVRITPAQINVPEVKSFAELHNDAEAKPGGRHDNDHADHREISIMPTADELLSKDRPFFRTADFIDDPKIVFSLIRL